MLRYHKIEIENFGAYKGKQVFELPESDGPTGISIVYALNGKGKTTLLNAFKFAFTGEVFDKKHDRYLHMREIFNKIELKNSDSKGMVELCFQHNDNEYVLTRELNKTTSIIQDKFSLRKNGDFLNDDEKTSVVLQIMPKQLVKFFLFDAAMLQEYSLLISNTDRSVEIRNAIDDALGLPYFQKSLDSLRSVNDYYLKEKGKFSKKNDKNSKILKEIEGLRESKNEKKGKLADLKSEKAEIQIEITEIKQKADENKDEKTLVDKLIGLEGEKSSLKLEIKNKKDEINESLKHQWIECLKSDIKEQKEKLVDEDFFKSFNPDLFHFLDLSINNEKCVLCESEIKGSHKNHLKKLKNSSEKIYKPLQKIKSLLSDDSQHVDLLKLESEYNELLTQKNNNKNDISELRNEGIDKDKNKIGELFSSFEKLLEVEKSYIEQISAINKDLDDIDGKIFSLSKNIISEIDEENIKIENKIDLTDYLISLMTVSLESHRNVMKKRIEKSASEWFSKATHLGYSGLKINNNYGMSLLNNDGTEMTIKSDGTEHMVSLALIQALYKNSPVSGPLMIDSPIGQLDPKHKKKMLRELPGINNQIVLLVHEGELNRKEAKECFKSLLKKEYKIESVNKNPLHSNIGIL